MTDPVNRVDDKLPESESVAEFSIERNSIGSRVAQFLHDNPAVVPLIVLLAAAAIFSALIGERFFSAFTLTLILQQVAIVGIVACAQSLVILTAGIDLSVGAIMVLSSVVMGKFTFDLGLPPGLAVFFRARVRIFNWLDKRDFGGIRQIAAVHRNARYVANRIGGKFSLFRK